LQVKPGDAIELSYFLPESGAKVNRRHKHVHVRRVVPMNAVADRTLMPDFPGIEKAESTSEWDAGFPLVHKIRPKDEDYWKKYRGTPKAFITLAAGQKMWGIVWQFDSDTVSHSDESNARPHAGERENRSQSQGEAKPAGNSTASERPRDEQRFPLSRGEGQGEGERKTQTTQSEPPHVVSYKERWRKKSWPISSRRNWVCASSRCATGAQAAEQSQDFGGLFLGFSFFSHHRGAAADGDVVSIWIGATHSGNRHVARPRFHGPDKCAGCCSAKAWPWLSWVARSARWAAWFTRGRCCTADDDLAGMRRPRRR